MIVILVSDLNKSPFKRLIRTSRGQLPKIKLYTYTQAFRHLRFPAAPLIFTDFDLLNAFEMDAAGAIAVTAPKNNCPVLNHPVHAMERTKMLHSLHRSGMNSVEVTRLELGERPQKYPVFIRLEDGCLKPDAGILCSELELETALQNLQSSGRTLKRRIAVSFESSKDADGYYRKYGAFRIGDRIIPQHILRDTDWIVKSNRAHVNGAFAAEELAYVNENPHAEALMRIFDHANIEFGRIDYTIHEGQIVTFEINMNPTFPRFKGGNPAREERRGAILNRLSRAFEAIDAPDTGLSVKFTVGEDLARYLKQRRWGWMDRRVFSLRLFKRQFEFRGKH